jgi:hypothetical protein
MKEKSVLFFVVLLIVTISVFSGCSPKQETIAEAISVSYEHSLVEARVGDTVSLNDNPFHITPMDASVVQVFSSSNPSIASVNAQTGLVTCLKEGTVTIYGHIKKADNKMISDQFILQIREQLFYATNFFMQCTKTIKLGLEDDDVLNEITYEGEQVNVFPTISYTNASVAQFDASTGKITPLTIGVTTVYVTLQTVGGIITKEFCIEVVQKMSYIEAEAVHNVSLDEFYYIYFQIIDNTQASGLSVVQKVEVVAITNVHFIEIVHTDFQTILIKTKQFTGTVLLKLTYVENSSITKTVGINIA